MFNLFKAAKVVKTNPVSNIVLTTARMAQKIEAGVLTTVFNAGKKEVILDKGFDFISPILTINGIEIPVDLARLQPHVDRKGLITTTRSAGDVFGISETIMGLKNLIGDFTDYQVSEGKVTSSFINYKVTLGAEIPDMEVENSTLKLHVTCSVGDCTAIERQLREYAEKTKIRNDMYLFG